MTKWNVYIFAILIFISKTSTKKTPKSKSAGTVLFHGKSCWQHEDVVLLSMRKLMQNLVPTNELCLDNDGFVTALMEYLQMSVQVVEEMSSGKSKDMLLLALCDAVGGYLHHYVVPITRQAYYAGNVRYVNAEKIFTLYRRIVGQLDTSTRGWSCPVDASIYPIKVYPLQIKPPQKCEDACTDIITSDRLAGTHFQSNKQDCLIPMPYLDDEAEPTAMAVPFRSSTLKKLTAPSSAFLVEKYYVASTKCLISKSATTQQLMNFNEKYCAWLSKSVIPHLKDDNWYAAFGGVLKILETMKCYNICTSQHKAYTMTHNPKPAPHKEPSGGVPSGHHAVASVTHTEPTDEESAAAVTRFILMALGLGIIAAWLCCGICYLCMRGSGRGGKNKRLDLNKSQDDSFQFINTFVQVFYDIKDRFSSGSAGSSSESKTTTSSSSCSYEMEDQASSKNTVSKSPTNGKNGEVKKSKSAPLPQSKSEGTTVSQPKEDEFENISLGYTSDSESSTEDGRELSAAQSK